MSVLLPLKNITVLVTRPAGLADSLLQRISDAGGRARHYPVITIRSIDNSEKLQHLIKHLPNFDIAVFISPTAVQKTLEKIPALPSQLLLAVIGRSTEVMLNKLGLQADIVPDGFDTESLLLHAAFQPAQIAGKTVIIFRGEGGLALLGSTLTQRGATVTYAEMYRREKNSLPPLQQAQLAAIDVLTVTSNESLQNLYALTEQSAKAALLALPVIVPGARARQLATQLGFNTIIQASNATDDACMQALLEFFAARADD